MSAFGASSKRHAKLIQKGNSQAFDSISTYDYSND
jgi:hypothetical protein